MKFLILLILISPIAQANIAGAFLIFNSIDYTETEGTVEEKRALSVIIPIPKINFGSEIYKFLELFRNLVGDATVN